MCSSYCREKAEGIGIGCGLHMSVEHGFYPRVHPCGAGIRPSTGSRWFAAAREIDYARSGLRLSGHRLKQRGWYTAAVPRISTLTFRGSSDNTGCMMAMDIHDLCIILSGYI